MQIFKVEGMTCAHCERAIIAAVREIDPAASVWVDLRDGTVAIESEAAADRLLAAITAEGYQPFALPVASTGG